MLVDGAFACGANSISALLEIDEERAGCTPVTRTPVSRTPVACAALLTGCETAVGVDQDTLAGTITFVVGVTALLAGSEATFVGTITFVGTTTFAVAALLAAFAVGVVCVSFFE